jgi:hypothetical protein
MRSCSAATTQQTHLIVQAAADEVTALEQRYWRAFNELDLQLAAHLQERDTILAKVSQHITTTQFTSLSCLCRNRD